MAKTPIDPDPPQDAATNGWRRLRRRAMGAGLVAIGVPMLVLPGPGIVSIAAGVGILASEYPSVRRGVDRLQDRIRR